MDDTSSVSNTDALILRRSTRKRKAVQEFVQPPQTKSTKRRRVAGPGPAGNQTKRNGKLEKMADLPVDVILEIFSWLNPVDLLHLSRTSKSWRNLLMTRSSTSIWRAARSNLSGFPDCPDDLDEPRYADLAFGRTCYFCFRTFSNTRLVWTARLRTCGRCLNNHFMTSLPQPNLETESREHPKELNIKKYLPHLWVLKFKGCRGNYITYVPRDIYFRLHAEYKEAQDKEAWLARYREKRHTMDLHAAAFESWHKPYRSKAKQG